MATSYVTVGTAVNMIADSLACRRQEKPRRSRDGCIICDPPAFSTLDYLVVWSTEGRPCAAPEAAAGPPAVSGHMAPTWRLHLAAGDGF